MDILVLFTSGCIGQIATIFIKGGDSNERHIVDVIVNVISMSISATYLWSLIPVGIAVITVLSIGTERLDVIKKPECIKAVTSNFHNGRDSFHFEL